MAIMPPGRVVEGSGLGTPLRNPGAPTNGTSLVQTLTFGSTPTAGTGTLAFGGFTAAAFNWSATNATLVANVLASLVALQSIGAAGVTVAVGTMTAGIGTLTLTMAAQNAESSLGGKLITVAANGLTGGTLTIATTTPGVESTYRHAAVGAILIDTTNALLYQNTSTIAGDPTWTKVGTET
jgi:hypothetical protein